MRDARLTPTASVGSSVEAWICASSCVLLTTLAACSSGCIWSHVGGELGTGASIPCAVGADACVGADVDAGTSAGVGAATALADVRGSGIE